MGSQIKKFLLVGILNFIVEFSLFSYLYAFFKINHRTSSIIAFISMLTFSYFINKYWTFRQTEKNRREAFYYFILYFILLIHKILILEILIRKFNISTISSNTFTMLITSCISFTILKYFIFRSKNTEITN